ncbi:MAG: hypothetical protein A2383_03225 [Candidatus Pacebacteria bacterium RIFOXYB1_FULL_39_46]|nr:MAG: hypothetical protein A2182_01270 [Candidatus Pacebacteria bacterium RIFOXYA1_FULL_38_18]OGJ38429.1 MAG: hypothetical protein A2383_03225 [Candidatus Pacebacteria bacterium RIFOXYB1_FULL_39_46]OGJ40290.1 MAG: hypothetical protein A2411_03370 [Candidatus Pacebacteria bacterium RIFOXYC1_FULL_39_21]OGJ40862.1 MAG: hypothetical protein A2582_02105 [Candidatus Pacebacteria bacterium RIFOXYD1_FULL_39_27]
MRTSETFQEFEDQDQDEDEDEDQDQDEREYRDGQYLFLRIPESNPNQHITYEVVIKSFECGYYKCEIRNVRKKNSSLNDDQCLKVGAVIWVKKDELSQKPRLLRIIKKFVA